MARRDASPYLLVCLLEIDARRQDVGDSPRCEISVGNRLVETPIPSTAEAHILVELPCHECTVAFRCQNSVGDVIGVAHLSSDKLPPPGRAVERWVPLSSAGPGTIREASSSCGLRLRVLAKYVDAVAAAQEPEVDRTFAAQDFLILALRCLNRDLERVPRSATDLASSRSTHCTRVQRTSVAAQNELRSQRLTSGEERVRAAQKMADREREELEILARHRNEPYRHIVGVLESKIEEMRCVADSLQPTEECLKQSDQVRRDLQQQLQAATERVRSQLEVERQRALTRLSESESSVQAELHRAADELHGAKQQGAELRARESSLESQVQLYVAELSAEEVAGCTLHELRQRLDEERGRRESCDSKRTRIERSFDEELLGMKLCLAAAQEERQAIAEELGRARTALESRHRCSQRWDQSWEATRTQIKNLEREVDDCSALRVDLSELQAHGGRLQEQLLLRTLQFEEVRKTFEQQLCRECEARQRLIREKHEISERLRIIEGQHQRQAEEVVQQKQRSSELCARIVELEQRLRVMGDVERLISQNNSRTQAREGVRSALRALLDSERNTFELHLQQDHQRYEALEGDNTHLRAVLQEIQPEYKQLQGEHDRVEKMCRARRRAEPERDGLLNAERLALQDAHAASLLQRQTREQLQRELWDVCRRHILHVEQVEETLESRDEELETRSAEARLLMTRIQELVTVYLPIKGDHVDALLAQLVNAHHPPVPFFRLSPGVYLFGSRRVLCKIGPHGRLVFRVGGGFCSFEEFLETYASEELMKLEQAQAHGNVAVSAEQDTGANLSRTSSLRSAAH